MEDSRFFKQLYFLVDKFKIPLVLGLLGTLLIGIGLLWPKINPTKKDIVVESSGQKSFGNSEKIGEKLLVDIAGAIAQPGVYQLEGGARIEDVIRLAGGFSIKADSNWIAKNLNLASKVVDGQKIYIQSLGETETSGSSLSSYSNSDKVNINFASAKELDTLPGVGQVTADKIISQRPYSSVDELLVKKVVGKSTFEKIKDLVSVY